MRLIAVLFSVLFFAMSPIANAKTKYKHSAKTVQHMQDIKRYILTWEEMAKLTPDNQVKYYRFLVGFLGTLEEMQPYPGPKGYGKKTAVMDALRKMIQLIQPEAMAAGGYQQVNDASMIGKMCVYGGSASTYTEFSTAQGPRYWCAPQGNDSCAEPFHTDCGSTSQLFKMMNPKGNGGPLCVPTFPENQTASSPGLTHRCVEAFEARLGGRFNEVVKAEFAKANNNKKIKDDWNAYVSKMREAVSQLEAQNFGGVTLREYCAQDSSGKYNALNYYKQDEECRALARLFADINGDLKIPPPAPQAPPVTVKTDGDIYAKCHNDQTHPELGELACVSCAVRVLGPQMGSNGDASKWVATLAIAAQNFQDNPGTGGSLQQRVIEMMLSAGYCTDSEYPGGNYSAHSGKVTQWIHGKMSKQDETAFMDAFGYYNDGTFGFNQLKRNLGDFKGDEDGNNGWGWKFTERNIMGRRKNFSSNLKSFGPKGNPDAVAVQAGLVNCTQSAARRLESSPAFNYCAREAKTANLDATVAFCANAARACGLTPDFCQKERLTKQSYKFAPDPKKKPTMANGVAMCPMKDYNVDWFGGGDGGGGGGSGGSGGSGGGGGGGSGGAGSGSH